MVGNGCEDDPVRDPDDVEKENGASDGSKGGCEEESAGVARRACHHLTYNSEDDAAELFAEAEQMEMDRLVALSPRIRWKLDLIVLPIVSCCDLGSWCG